MKLEKKAKYPLHSIKIKGNYNEVVIEYLKIKEHHRRKYFASKKRKRGYYSKN